MRYEMDLFVFLLEYLDFCHAEIDRSYLEIVFLVVHAQRTGAMV